MNYRRHAQLNHGLCSGSSRSKFVLSVDIHSPVLPYKTVCFKNHMPSKTRIPYLLPNFSTCTFEVWDTYLVKRYGFQYSYFLSLNVKADKIHLGHIQCQQQGLQWITRDRVAGTTVSYNTKAAGGFLELKLKTQVKYAVFSCGFVLNC